MCSHVVIYLKFTSNHNLADNAVAGIAVVIYLKFTSNHNLFYSRSCRWRVVIYLKFTSNHNETLSSHCYAACCNLFKIYIKPQQ